MTDKVVVKLISKSKDGNRAEVVRIVNHTSETLHLVREGSAWRDADGKTVTISNG